MPAVSARIEAALTALTLGQPVVVADHPGRENEGDLIMAAEKVTPAQVAFMVRHTSGILCVSLLADRLEQLRLPLMVNDNTESHRTAGTAPPPASPPPTARPPFGLSPTPPPPPRASPGRDTFSRCGPKPVGSSSAPAIPRPPSICCAWLVCFRLAC